MYLAIPRRRAPVTWRPGRTRPPGEPRPGGSRALFIPGIIVIALGATLEAGATSAVKAVKMSAKLLPGRQQAPGDQALPGEASHREDA